MRIQETEKVRQKLLELAEKETFMNTTVDLLIRALGDIKKDLIEVDKLPVWPECVSDIMNEVTLDGYELRISNKRAMKDFKESNTWLSLYLSDYDQIGYGSSIIGRGIAWIYVYKDKVVSVIIRRAYHGVGGVIYSEDYVLYDIPKLNVEDLVACTNSVHDLWYNIYEASITYKGKSYKATTQEEVDDLVRKVKGEATEE